MKYKVVPCIHSSGSKGWKIIIDNSAYVYEHPYCPDGEYFIVYSNYQAALEDCEHLNGKSKVFGQITQDSWDVLRMLFKGWK